MEGEIGGDLVNAILTASQSDEAGYLDREVMRAAIPLGTLAALAAAWAATSVDITVFRKPFGVFLLWAGANMLLQKKK